MADDIKQIEEKLNKLKASLDKVGQKSLERVIAALKSGGAGLDEWNDQLSTFQDKVDKVNNSLSYIAQSFKESVNELSRQNKYLTSSRNIISKISTSAREVLSARRGEISLDEKSVKLAQEKINSQREELKQALQSKSLNKSQRKEIKSVISSLDDYKNGLEGALKTHKEINKQLGIIPQVFGGLDKGLSKLGMSGLGISEALSKTQKLGQEAASLGDEEFKKFSATKTFFKELGSGFSEIVSKANIIQFVIGGLIDGFIQSQKGIGEMAKGLGMSATRAADMRHEFANISNLSMNANLTVKDLQASQIAVGQALGSNAMLNEADLETMTDIVKKTGLQHSELMGIEKLSLATGVSLDDNVESALGGATAFANQNKMVIDNNKVLREVNKASSSLKLSLGGSVKELGKAVVQAQMFGLTLEQAEKISSGLLDFESSIENELSAELLTGKDLNFERARGLALNGDIAGATAEIAAQVGTAAEFGKMNVIQQEAIAKAVGLSRDELASSLIEKESLAALNAKEGQTALEAYEALKKQGLTQDEIIAKIGEKAAADLEQQSAQDKFNASVEKLKEIFTQVMDALAPVFDGLANIATVIMPAINYVLAPLVEGFKLIGMGVDYFIKGLKEGQPLIVGLTAALVALKAQTIMTAIFSIFGGLAKLGIPGLVLAGIATAGMISLATSSKTANDMVAPPGYGKRTLLGPEGAIQLNDKDTVIAGTNLFGNDVKSEPGKSTQMGNKGEIKVKSEGGDMASVIAAINALANRPINIHTSVQMDGKEIATAQGKYPKEAGDANRNVAYQMS